MKWLSVFAVAETKVGPLTASVSGRALGAAGVGRQLSEKRTATPVLRVVMGKDCEVLGTVRR